MGIRMNRRAFLTATGSAALLAACGTKAKAEPGRPGAILPGIASDPLPSPAAEGPAPAAPAATPAPRVVRPLGTYERTLMAGTPWATAVSIRDSGVAGNAAIVLGGVHGNEPGGWLAAEEVANWVPRSGSLLVIPRANRLAIDSFVRTFEEIGDLNRLYPGDPGSALAMERMAGEITALATEFGCGLALDMHESWAFYVDAPGTGTAALGQTITTGQGPLWPNFGPAIATALNDGLPSHDRFIVRDGTNLGRPAASATPATTGRGRSSLGLGGHVAGLTPVLVEMGQQGQDVDRRIALHLLVARQALSMIEVV